MDEAFSALDPLIRSGMQDQLIELQNRLHKTIVFITHDLDEALRLGDKIAILKDGVLSQVGRPEEILLDPADEYVEAFVRDVNRARVLTVEFIMKPAEFPLTTADIGKKGPTLRPNTVLQDALPVTLNSNSPVPVVSEDGTYLGTLSKHEIVDILANSNAQPSDKNHGSKLHM